MERIVLEVDEATAKKWDLSSQKRREQLSQKINIRLAKELMEDSKEDFKQFLNEVGETMEKRGLTDDILQEILDEDE
ncbi:MAG TPA: hypothetical protein VIQ00_03510 [Chitinophagaceae bacterium]